MPHPAEVNGLRTSTGKPRYSFQLFGRINDGTIEDGLDLKARRALHFGRVPGEAAALGACGTRVAPRGTTNPFQEQGASTMSAQQTLDNELRRVQGEFNEMPGLRLTLPQAQRLWGLDRAACDSLLGALVDAKFLLRTRDGAFVRSDQVRASRM